MGVGGWRETPNLNRLAPKREDKAVPAAQPGGPKQAQDRRTSRQLSNTHAWRRPRRWGWIAGRKRQLYRLDPRQENSLPALRRSKPAACPQAVPAQRVGNRCPSFELSDPDLDPDPESAPVRARAEATSRSRPRQHSSLASITAEQSRRGSARR